MRLYVPVTLAELASYVAAGRVPADAERFVAPDDSEEGEYAALMSAADASATLLAGPGRRVVVVAEISDEGDPDCELPASTWAAVHADAKDRPEGADPEEDLAWFATQEIPDLLA